MTTPTEAEFSVRDIVTYETGGRCDECGARTSLVVGDGEPHARSCSSYMTLLTITSKEGWSVHVHSNGEVECVGLGASVEAAAREFWNALGALAEIAYKQGRADERTGR